LAAKKKALTQNWHYSGKPKADQEPPMDKERKFKDRVKADETSGKKERIARPWSAKARRENRVKKGGWAADEEGSMEGWVSKDGGLAGDWAGIYDMEAYLMYAYRFVFFFLFCRDCVCVDKHACACIYACMYVCMYVYACVCNVCTRALTLQIFNVCSHACVCVSICLSACMYVCTWACMHVYVGVHVCMHVHNVRICASTWHISNCALMHAYACMCSCIHVCMHACMMTYM
jgi:hypothetical protein